MKYEDISFEASNVFDSSDVEWSNVSPDKIHIGYLSVTTATGTVSRFVGVPFCPDLIRYQDLGVADNLYGHVVRGFFWMMRWWR